MIALLYAVIPAASLPVATMTMMGVLKAEVHAHVNARHGLALLYSSFQQKPELPMPQSALEVHALMQKLLGRSGIIPFRLPTWLAEQEIPSHLDSRSEAYSHALDKIADCLQMELHLTSSHKPATVNAALSGREYLQSRATGQSILRNAAAASRAELDAASRDWRQHWVADGVLKLSALVPRSERERFANSSARLQIEEVAVRVSGPWPPTDFIELNAPPRAEQDGTA